MLLDSLKPDERAAVERAERFWADPSEPAPMPLHYARDDALMLAKALAEARAGEKMLRQELDASEKRRKTAMQERAEARAEARLEAVEGAYESHKFSQARQFMQIVGSILKGESK